MRVVVKSPRSYPIVSDIEHVGPSLAGPELITASAASTSDSEGPGAVGVDSIPDSVDVQTVAILGIAIEEGYVQPFAGPCVQNSARDSSLPSRLVDVGLY